MDSTDALNRSRCRERRLNNGWSRISSRQRCMLLYK